MKMQVLAIRDICADVYLQPPMFVNNIGSAIRDFGDACKGEPQGNQLSKHPEHYELWHVAEWDDGTASFEQLEIHKQLAVGLNYSK